MEEDILKKDGLSLDKLRRLSYHSDLGIHLKKNLHYFDKEALFKELDKMNEWYDSCDILHETVTDYRIKSIQSARMKYERYFPEHQARKVFNDMLGFRALCDNYENVLMLDKCRNIRVVDISEGKALGCILRKEYESGRIITENEFREVLNCVLSDCKEV